MRPRTDTTGLTLGLLFLLIAGLGLWAAFGSVDWSGLGVAVPLALVLIGVLGLRSANSK